MSLLQDLNITNEVMTKYSPLGQLSSKYLSQVLKDSSVVTFDEGEQIFEKKHDLEAVYFLIKGALKIKSGLFSSTTLDARSPECLNPINSKIPIGVSAKAQKAGMMLVVDEKLLDRALGWSQAEQDKLSRSQAAQGSDQGGEGEDEAVGDSANTQEPGQFDEEHFGWVTSLMEFPLFFNLPPSNMESLLEKFNKVAVSRDQVIIEEGDDGDYFYLLMEGSARVIIGGDESRPIRLNKGSYFGEEALISDTVRSATVIMSEDGVLARLDKASFQSLLNDPLVSHVTRKQFQDEIQSNPAYELLDIRSHAEFEHIPAPKCLHIPLTELRQRLPSLDTSKTYYLTEEGGQRSDVAAHILCQNSVNAKVIRG